MQQLKAQESSSTQEGVLKFKILDLGHNNQIYYAYDDSTPVITMDISFKGAGYALDNNDLGISYALLYMLKQYEVGQNSQKLKNIIEENGIQIEFSIDQENFYISLKTIKQNLKVMQEILQIFLNPKFYDEKLLTQVKENLLQKYKINMGNAHFVANINQNKTLFANSDLDKNPYGNATSHKNITVKNLEKIAQERFTKNNMILSVSGNITQIELEKFYTKITKNLTENFRLRYKPYAHHYKPSEQQHKLAKDQVLIRAYFPSIAKNNSNFYKYYIANYLIGGAGLNSILTKEIREKHGLTYSIYSYFDIYNDFSIWVCEMSTDKNKAEEALKILRATLANIQKHGFSDEEISRAKEYLVGSFDIYFSSNDKVSSYLQDAMLRNISPVLIRNRNNIISSYNAAEINDIVKKFINVENISYLVVGEVEKK